MKLLPGMKVRCIGQSGGKKYTLPEVWTVRAVKGNYITVSRQVGDQHVGGGKRADEVEIVPDDTTTPDFISGAMVRCRKSNLTYIVSRIDGSHVIVRDDEGYISAFDWKELELVERDKMMNPVEGEIKSGTRAKLTGGKGTTFEDHRVWIVKGKPYNQSAAYYLIPEEDDGADIEGSEYNLRQYFPREFEIIPPPSPSVDDLRKQLEELAYDFISSHHYDKETTRAISLIAYKLMKAEEKKECANQS